MKLNQINQLYKTYSKSLSVLKLVFVTGTLQRRLFSNNTKNSKHKNVSTYKILITRNMNQDHYSTVVRDCPLFISKSILLSFPSTMYWVFNSSHTFFPLSAFISPLNISISLLPKQIQYWLLKKEISFFFFVWHQITEANII